MNREGGVGGYFGVNRNVKETGTFLAMISVGNRDGRKGLEQGFSTSKRDMDETELEEGEACSYQDHDEDASIDPDIALSYIVRLFELFFSMF